MSIEPPPFQEASRCDVCKCSFSTFRRRHHCRCCGRTLCADHSSDHMALPQFGIHSDVRVCAECFNKGASNLYKERVPVLASPNAVNTVTDSVSRLDISGVTDIKPGVKDEIPECKCGMPLCICEAPAPPPSDPVILQPVRTTSSSQLQINQKPKKAESTPKSSRGSTSQSKQSNIFNPGQVVTSSMDTTSVDYKVTGEGLREAIKNGDTAGAKKLLSQGVDANYCDKQGSSLLHLAAVFNQTETAFALMDHGANLDCKNSQGETPLDCAPATLQFKMRKKMEENLNSDT